MEMIKSKTYSVMLNLVLFSHCWLDIALVLILKLSCKTQPKLRKNNESHTHTHTITRTIYDLMTQKYYQDFRRRLYNISESDVKHMILTWRVYLSWVLRWPGTTLYVTFIVLTTDLVKWLYWWSVLCWLLSENISIVIVAETMFHLVVNRDI